MARIKNKDAFDYKGYTITPNYNDYNDPFAHGFVDRYLIYGNDNKCIGHAARTTDAKTTINDHIKRNTL